MRVCQKQPKTTKNVYFSICLKMLQFFFSFGCSYFAPLEQVIPNRRPAEIDVEVCVTSLHAHETIPGVGKQQQRVSLSARGWLIMAPEISLSRQNNSYRQKSQQPISQKGTAPGKIVHNGTPLPWKLIEEPSSACRGTDDWVIEPDGTDSICLKASSQ